ncbi:MAG: hypothetical protein IT318_14815 [Anaerolineales bacterium]|nr:hypothetical protein [Anaerolineales bacterium]
MISTPHAGYVAGLAGALFDATRSLHHQSPAVRTMLVAAARLHELAAGDNGAAPAGAGEAPGDVRLAAGLPRGQRAILLAALRLAAWPGDPAKPGASLPEVKAHQKKVVRLIAALLQAADALDEAQDQSIRLEAVTIEPGRVVARLSGPRAPRVARQAHDRARLWRSALRTRLEFTFTPLSPAELAQLATSPPASDWMLSRGLQRLLAGALLRWQASLESVVAGQAGAMVAAEQATTYLRQALAAFQAALKRKPSRRLRQDLGALETLLREANDWDRLRGSLLAFQSRQRPDAAAGLQPFVDAAGQAAQQAQGIASAWLHGPAAFELAETLVDFAGLVPVRRKQEVAFSAAVPEQLRAAAAAMGTAQAKFSAQEPKALRRLANSALRCRAWLDAAGDAGRLDIAAADLGTDLGQLAQRLDVLRQLDTADAAVGAFLDRWAVRQARRKAPQLHGAEPVLAFRQAVRAQRRQEQRALAGDWRPVRGRTLNRRLAKVLAALARGPARPDLPAQTSAL